MPGNATAGKTTLLNGQPDMLVSYAKAALALLPLPGGGGGLPQRTLEIPGFRVDADNLAAYARVCGLRLGDALPITYGFVLTFPSVMRLMTSRDFPMPAVGMVHVANRIEQDRPLSVSEPLDIRVHAEGLEPHRKGMQVRFVSEISVGRESVWRQTSTFLKIGEGSGEATEQAGSAEGASESGRPEAEQAQSTPVDPAGSTDPADLGDPTTTLRAEQKITSRYAAVSGDRNPLHVSTLGAKAFGFPRTIAHGMWSAAAALGALEGSIPDAAVYDVRFGKPVMLPSTINEYVEETETGWDVALRHRKKGYPYLTGTVSHA